MENLSLWVTHVRELSVRFTFAKGKELRYLGCSVAHFSELSRAETVAGWTIEELKYAKLRKRYNEEDRARFKYGSNSEIIEYVDPANDPFGVDTSVKFFEGVPHAR